MLLKTGSCRIRIKHLTILGFEKEYLGIESPRKLDSCINYYFSDKIKSVMLT